MTKPESNSKIDGLAQMGEMLDDTNPEQSGDLVEGETVTFGHRARRAVKIGGTAVGLTAATVVAGEVDFESEKVDSMNGPGLRVPQENAGQDRTYTDPNGITITPTAEGTLHVSRDQDLGIDPVGEENADQVAPVVTNTLEMAEAREIANANLPEPNPKGDATGGIRVEDHGGQNAE